MHGKMTGKPIPDLCRISLPPKGRSSGEALPQLHGIYTTRTNVVVFTMSDEVRIADVNGKKVQWDPAQMRKIQEHPCFSEKACHSFGRCHIPVAPKCNIQCNYCIRDFDCVNESRPGVTTRVLNPDESMEMVKKVVEEYNYIKVVGIAGPGRSSR